MKLSNKLMSEAKEFQEEPFNLAIEINCITELPEYLKIRAKNIAWFDNALKVIKLDGVTEHEALEILKSNPFREVEEGQTELTAVQEAQATKYMGA